MIRLALCAVIAALATGPWWWVSDQAGMTAFVLTALSLAVVTKPRGATDEA